MMRGLSRVQPRKGLWNGVVGSVNSREGHRLDVFDKLPGASVAVLGKKDGRIRLQMLAEARWWDVFLVGLLRSWVSSVRTWSALCA